MHFKKCYIVSISLISICNSLWRSYSSIYLYGRTMEKSHAKSGKNLQAWLKITFKYLGRTGTSNKKPHRQCSSQFAKFLLKINHILPCVNKQTILWKYIANILMLFYFITWLLNCYEAGYFQSSLLLYF